MNSLPECSTLDLGDGRRIAIRHRPGAPDRPTLVFLPGYASDMEGTKALTVDAFAERAGAACLRFDYSGCGSSEGDFADGTLVRWLEETLAAIDRLTVGPLILVGSSMGGWLALLAALRRPERVTALVGIAAAPDFTDWGFTQDEKLTLLRHGKIERPDPDGALVTTRSFWQSGEALRLLGAPIAIDCPVRLLHGDADAVVPVGIPLKLVAQLRSADVQLLLVKGVGHRMSGPGDLDALLGLLGPLMETGR